MSQPVCYGASVIGLKYKDGVIIGSDSRLNKYGTSKFMNIERITKLTDDTFISSSGEYADFIEISKELTEIALEDKLSGEGFLGPKQFTSYLANLCYEKRCDMKPYMNTTILGGILEDGTPYLTSVDQYGSKLENNYLVSGFGSYFAKPMLDAECKDYTTLTRDRALDLLREVFKVLFYRDNSAGKNINFAVLENDKNNTKVPLFKVINEDLSTNWDFKGFVENSSIKTVTPVN